jgi:hypothetical protein
MARPLTRREDALPAFARGGDAAGRLLSSEEALRLIEAAERAERRAAFGGPGPAAALLGAGAAVLASLALAASP